MSEALARREVVDLEPFELTQQRAAVLRKTIAQGLTEPEFELFAEYVRRTRLDPFRRQVYALKLEGERGRVSIHVGIDGLRLIARRSGNYRGQTPAQWCGPDGKWVDVWLDDETPPAAARVGIYHDEMAHPVWGLAKYREFVQVTTNRQTGEVHPNRMWTKFPSHMLAKVAESIAIRKAFPDETSGLYVSVDEEGEVDEKPRVTNPDAPATNYQKGELMRLARMLDFTDAERHERAGVASFTELTKGQASELIDEWIALFDARMAGEAEGELVEDPEAGRETAPAPGPADDSDPTEEQSQGGAAPSGDVRSAGESAGAAESEAGQATLDQAAPAPTVPAPASEAGPKPTGQASGPAEDEPGDFQFTGGPHKGEWCSYVAEVDRPWLFALVTRARAAKQRGEDGPISDANLEVATRWLHEVPA